MGFASCGVRVGGDVSLSESNGGVSGDVSLSESDGGVSGHVSGEVGDGVTGHVGSESHGI